MVKKWLGHYNLVYFCRRNDLMISSIQVSERINFFVLTLVRIKQWINSLFLIEQI